MGYTEIYRYQDQDGEHQISREEILQEYYPWWCEQMKKAGKGHLISEIGCIEDWVTVNWAWKENNEPIRDQPTQKSNE